jgi:hypothetical protein
LSLQLIVSQCQLSKKTLMTMPGFEFMWAETS